MLNSMTGFASGQGAFDRYGWTWELRSVNGKGLDLRLRLPDWIDGLEQKLRAQLGQALARGSVSVSLKLQTRDTAGRSSLNEDNLSAVLTAMAEIETRAMEAGLSLAPANAADILGLRGILEEAQDNDDATALLAALLKDFDAVLTDFKKMRAREGAALEKVVRGQLSEIERLTDAANTAAAARRPDAEAQFRAALETILQGAQTIDEDRVAQELAILAMKSDVTEELDRLKAHVSGARALLDQGSPVGRKLDFLAQEFNREANTLCSKSQNTDLTTIGLELKSAIEQMREQVQNVE